MISATDLKNSKTFLHDGKPYKVLKYAHQKIGRGGATVRLSVVNLLTGVLGEKTMSSAIKVEEIATSKKALQFLYSDNENATFIDPNSFNQIEIPRSVIAEELHFIKEGQEVNVLFWDERPLSVEIAPKVTLQVVQTDPGVRGNSATNVYKPAKLENGLEIKVPLFINTDDKIRVDTRTGDYIERVTNKSSN